MVKTIFHGLLAGILAAAGGIGYKMIYDSLGYDFNEIVGTLSIAIASIIGCLLMALGYGIIQRRRQPKLKGILNLLIVGLSFASILGPMAMTLPLTIEMPEMFPGLVIPMHLIPALSFLAIAPFFEDSEK